jgi:hypothetical protein
MYIRIGNNLITYTRVTLRVISLEMPFDTLNHSTNRFFTPVEQVPPVYNNNSITSPGLHNKYSIHNHCLEDVYRKIPQIENLAYFLNTAGWFFGHFKGGD